MQWFRNLLTTFKILSLVLVMLLIMLLISFVGYRTSSTISSDMNSLYDNYAMPAITMAQAQGLAIQNRRMLISMSMSTDATVDRQYESRILENRKRIGNLIAEYEKTNLTQEERVLLTQLTNARSNLNKLQDEVLAVLKVSTTSDEIDARMAHGGDVAVASDTYNELFDKIVTLLVNICSDVNKSAAIMAQNGTMSIAISAIAAILAGIGIGILVSRLITAPIQRIQESIKLFSDGDLASDFPAIGKDELAQMGRSLQDMANNLKNIIGAVKDASDNINETAQEFSALAEETNASVEEFRSNVDEMGTNLNSLASTGEEVNASVEEVAAGAQATAEKGTDIARHVDEAMSAGENGMNSVRRAVSGIDGVAKNAADAARSVQELGARTRQIQSFVSQIGGIADQTNLLALNAAIEAARAGEAGRGFAVVAEEVRKLAEDSNSAAKNIAELAETITGDLDNVVNISLGNAKASQEAKDLSRETEEIIGSMINYLRGISGATQDLAAVSEEQAASSEEIAEAVQNIATRVASTAEASENIRSGVGEISVAAERMAQGAEGLSGLSGGLLEQLAFFKLDESSQKTKDRDNRLKVLSAPRR
ncbi:MAG: methyl-accepting chemotaxis protein [Synergistaceae bacterium]|nr:methyl-accepting chemotaxis protein [Synergistaceae bacterium]